MTNGEWLTQKLTEFVDWTDKHSINIAFACWSIVTGCLMLLCITQRLELIAVFVPTAIIGTVVTANAIIKWLDAEHEERKENKE